MAISFENNWKNILDKLTSVLRDEYGNTMPIFTGEQDNAPGNQYIRLDPIGSSLMGYSLNSQNREFEIIISYVSASANVKKTALEHILRFTERTKAVVQSNMSMVLSDGTRAINCRLDSEVLDSGTGDNSYIVTWSWKCEHQSNFS